MCKLIHKFNNILLRVGSEGKYYHLALALRQRWGHFEKNDLDQYHSN